MTKEEWLKVAKGLQSMYGKDHGLLQDPYSVTLWFELLKDIDYPVVMQAVKKIMMQSHFPPTVSDIRKTAMEISEGEIPEWSEEYEKAYRIVSRYGYYRPDEAKAEMTDITRETVNRIGWNTFCNDENTASTRAAFRDIYTGISEQRKSTAMISESLRNQISEIRSKRMMVEEKERNDDTYTEN